MLQMLGQFLALVAMTASVVNAQCVVSCSLLTQPVSFDEKAHACCPHESAPNPNRQRHNASCPPLLPAASKDRAEQTKTTIHSLTATVELDFNHPYDPLAANSFIDRAPPSEPPTLRRPSSISILKI